MMDRANPMTPRERKLKMLRDLEAIIKTLGPGSVRDDLVFTQSQLIEELKREEKEEEEKDLQ